MSVEIIVVIEGDRRKVRTKEIWERETVPRRTIESYCPDIVEQQKRGKGGGHHGHQISHVYSPEVEVGITFIESFVILFEPESEVHGLNGLEKPGCPSPFECKPLL